MCFLYFLSIYLSHSFACYPILLHFTLFRFLRKKYALGDDASGPKFVALQFTRYRKSRIERIGVRSQREYRAVVKAWDVKDVDELQWRINIGQSYPDALSFLAKLDRFGFSESVGYVRVPGDPFVVFNTRKEDASVFPKNLVDHFSANGAMEFGFLERVVTNLRAVDVIQT